MMESIRRIEFGETGGPEVLRQVEIPAPAVGPNEVRVRHDAIGVNYIDTYHRSGLYPVPALPSGIGLEAAGTVIECGAEVTQLREKDRVAYCTGPLGAYATSHVIPADRVVPLPEGIDAPDAAAAMLKGLTIQYLIRQIYPVKAGETVLFHAAAGGVGLLAMQWLRALGVTVIGTVGSEEKADLARQYGCTHPILYDREDVVARVREITDGAGVPVVFDSVGAATFERSLDCLARRGLMISFGNASGAVPPFSLGMTASRGSLMITRPSLMDYVATKEALRASANEFFGHVRSGTIKIVRNPPILLSEATFAHKLLESRATTGSTILVP